MKTKYIEKVVNPKTSKSTSIGRISILFLVQEEHRPSLVDLEQSHYRRSRHTLQEKVTQIAETGDTQCRKNRFAVQLDRTHIGGAGTQEEQTQCMRSRHLLQGEQTPS
jgi:hypothetical protein